MCSRECVWQKLSMKWKDFPSVRSRLVCLVCVCVWMRAPVTWSWLGNLEGLETILVFSWFILSFVLAQGSRVIWVCVRNICTYTYTHSKNESIWCMLDRFMVLDCEHLTSPLGSCSQSQGGYRQYIQIELVSDANKPRCHCLSPCSLQAVHFSLKMINVHANYQSMGTHSNMGDSNQETVIWKTI